MMWLALNKGIILTGVIFFLAGLPNYLPSNNPLLGGDPSGLIIQEEGEPKNFKVDHTAELIWMNCDAFMTMFALQLIAVGTLCQEKALLCAYGATYVVSMFLGVGMDILFPITPGKRVDPFILVMQAVLSSPILLGMLLLPCSSDDSPPAPKKTSGVLNKCFLAQGCVWILCMMCDFLPWYMPAFGGNPEKLAQAWFPQGQHEFTRFDMHVYMTSAFFGAQLTVFMLLMGCLTTNELLLRAWGTIFLVFAAYSVAISYTWGFTASTAHQVDWRFVVGMLVLCVLIFIGVLASLVCPVPAASDKSHPLLHS
eukprot:TRINITY_DN92735_c0_g1_i1.p1 TRINITY_DN92735_c0_g1~~TRINITY_DN92735_c0_g1_i1.p1  ORF type:complete len:323 (-),score=33.50 TRINITY_DN92735_c0_g1_i1:258-1187(-)